MSEVSLYISLRTSGQCVRRVCRRSCFPQSSTIPKETPRFQENAARRAETAKLQLRDQKARSPDWVHPPGSALMWPRGAASSRTFSLHVREVRKNDRSHSGQWGRSGGPTETSVSSSRDWWWILNAAISATPTHTSSASPARRIIVRLPTATLGFKVDYAGESAKSQFLSASSGPPRSDVFFSVGSWGSVPSTIPKLRAVSVRLFCRC